jgi:heme exporter protein B
MSALVSVLQRDLLLAFRHRQELLNPLMFFVITCSLFPLGVSPEKTFLGVSAAGILWVAALLATLLSLDMLFRADFEDGALEQMMMAPQPLFLLVLAKIIAHWLVTGLPLIVLSPLLGVMLFLPTEQIPVLMLTLLLGTPALSLIGAVGAALIVGLRGGGRPVVVTDSAAVYPGADIWHWCDAGGCGDNAV